MSADRCEGCGAKKAPLDPVLLGACDRCGSRICSECAATFDRDGGFAVCEHCHFMEQHREARRESGV